MTNEEIVAVARCLHGKLFATMTDWREELCDWDQLPAGPKREFCSVAADVIEALRNVERPEPIRVNADGGTWAPR